MAKTVMGLFNNMNEARRVVQELIDHGFKPDDIGIVAREDGEYVTERAEDKTSGAAIGAGAGATAGGIIGALTDLGVPEEAAHYYAEGVRRGGALVSVETDDAMADQAAEIMGRYGAVDIDERVQRWRGSGWTHFDPNTGPYQATDPRPYVDPNTGPYRSSEERMAGERRTAPPRRSGDSA